MVRLRAVRGKNESLRKPMGHESKTMKSWKPMVFFFHHDEDICNNNLFGNIYRCPNVNWDNAYFIWVLPLTGSSMRSMGFEPALRSMRDQRSTTTAILAGQLNEQFKTIFKARIPFKRLREWLKNLPLFRGDDI